MSDSPRILVATDVVGDADLVKKLLREEFDNVFSSTHSDRAVSDFEKQRPEILILAFNSLEKAERYYLGLYRLSEMVHALPHRTLILCNKEDLRRVYELCRKEYFDDYILFWPMSHDAPRLPMAVHHALRQLRATGSGAPTVEEFAAQARRLTSMESLVEQYAARGNAQIDTASHSLEQTQDNIEASMDSFASKLSRGDLDDLVEIKDAPGLEREIARLKIEGAAARANAVASAVQPVREWASGFKQILAPQLESTRALQALAERIRSHVLLVDDDDFQHKLLGNLLRNENLELSFATSGTEALSILRKRKPDLILMDVSLPDINGIEVTRRIKSIQQFASIPVVMVTGQSDKAVVVQSLKAGATGFLVKPLNREVLLTKIQSCLNANEAK